MSTSAERVAVSQYQPIDKPDSYITAYENYRYWSMRVASKQPVPVGKLREAMVFLQRSGLPLVVAVCFLTL